MVNERILGEERISKLFIKYTIPAIISMVLAGSQTMIDGMFLGNYVGPNALASVNIVNPYVQIAMGVSIVIALGSLSIIGRKLGAGDKITAQNTFKTAFLLIMIFVVLYGCIGILNSETISLWLGSDQVLLEGVATYIKTFAFFLPFLPLMVLTGFADRIIGKPHLYLQATIFSLIVNVGLDYIFIKMLSLGLRGAALATGLAYCAGLLVTIRPMLEAHNVINIRVGRFDQSVIVPMLYNGSSEGIVSASAALATYLFNVEFMKQAGPSGVAAFTTISYVVNFGIMIIFGIADGVSPIISYNFGHRHLERVKEILSMARKSGLFVGGVLFIVLFLGGESLVKLFSKSDLAVIQMATLGGRIYAFAFLVNSINLIYSVYFTAIGNAKASALIALSRGFVCILIGINLWPIIFGITGVWITVPVAEFLTVGLVAYIYKRYPLEREYERSILYQAS